MRFFAVFSQLESEISNPKSPAGSPIRRLDFLPEMRANANRHLSISPVNGYNRGEGGSPSPSEVKRNEANQPPLPFVPCSLSAIASSRRRIPFFPAPNKKASKGEWPPPKRRPPRPADLSAILSAAASAKVAGPAPPFRKAVQAGTRRWRFPNADPPAF